MLAIVLVVLAALCLATDDPGFRIVKAIGEIDHTFADERMEVQFFGLHDHIEHHFQIIAKQLGLTQEELAKSDMVGQMFTIAWIWLQPRRSFKDTKRMFQVTLQCYENIIDIRGQARLTRATRATRATRDNNNKVCKSEILSAKKRWRAVRQHVNQILMYSERDGEVVPAPRGTMFRTQLDHVSTQRYVMAYRESVLERFADLVDSILHRIEDVKLQNVLSELSFLLQQQTTYEQQQSNFYYVSIITARIAKKIRQRSSGSSYNLRFNRDVSELRRFSAGLPGLLEFIDEVLAYKLIMPDRVPALCAKLHKLPSGAIDPGTIPMPRRSNSL